jgi:general nucleoside transport system permease protein
MSGASERWPDMESLLTEAFLTSLLFGAVTAGVPLLLAGLGEQISEKAGVLNIGIEGMMLMGAYAGFVAAFYTESFALGFVAGGLGGMAVAVIVMVLCIRHGLNQIVIGIALTIGAEGLTALLHHFQFSKTYPRLSQAPVLEIPLLSKIPVIGVALFSHNPVVYLGVLLMIALTWLFKATYVGINLEAAGNKPAALDAAGVSVIRTRSVAVLTTGFLAGVGGAYMANVGAGLFVPFMTGGAGFIGIVLAMLARGRPVWVLLGAALFGISLAMTTALQVAGINIPTDVVQMLPFAMVMLVLVIFARHSVLPPALGLPYVRGDR